MPVRTVIEHGPKDKRSVAFSLDWPGWSRGARTAELVLETLEAYLVAAMRAYNAGEMARRMRSWTLPFLIRHSAYHVLDHAWEMEDRDLSATAGADED